MSSLRYLQHYLEGVKEMKKFFCAEIGEDVYRVSEVGAAMKNFVFCIDYKQLSCLVAIGLKEQIATLTAENKRLRDALDTIESMATDTTHDIQGIAQAAIKKSI